MFHTPTGFRKGENVFSPGRLVKIGGEKPAGLVLQHGIDADDVTSPEVIQNHIGRYRQEGLVGALTTFHPGFFAHPANPFIGTGGRVTFLARFLILPQSGKHIVPAAEEPEKKDDLFLWS